MSFLRTTQIVDSNLEIHKLEVPGLRRLNAHSTDAKLPQHGPWLGMVELHCRAISNSARLLPGL